MKKLIGMISFTKSETKVILFIISVLVAGYTIKYYKHLTGTNTDTPYDYSRSDSEFFARSEKNFINEKDLSGSDTSADFSRTSEYINSGDIIISESKDADSQKVLNINTALKVELVALPGIGESIADRIIAYRNENKKFRKTDELMNVSGIGRKKFEKIRKYIKAE